jgi:hypothetical protein
MFLLRIIYTMASGASRELFERAGKVNERCSEENPKIWPGKCSLLHENAAANDALRFRESLANKNAVLWDMTPLPLVKTDVSLECRASIKRLITIGELRDNVNSNEQPMHAVKKYYVSYVLPKRRFLQKLRGVTSQKTAFFKATAVKTSNFT